MQYETSADKWIKNAMAQRFAEGVQRSLIRQGAERLLTAASLIEMPGSLGSRKVLSLAQLASEYEGSPGGTWSPEDLLAEAIATGQANVLEA